MTAQNWVNKDGLVLQYGTDKAIPEVGGEYLQYGANRMAEVLIDLSKLVTANATVLSLTEIFPATSIGGVSTIYIEKVELLAEVAMSTSSSPTLSIGVVNMPLTTGSSTVSYNGSVLSALATVPSNGATAFVSAIPAASLAAGSLVRLAVGGSSPIGADSYIGNYVGVEDTSNLTSPMYLTATLGTATATGSIRCRIFYHGIGTIQQ
jgi:hypothetical protein